MSPSHKARLARLERRKPRLPPLETWPDTLTPEDLVGASTLVAFAKDPDEVLTLEQAEAFLNEARGHC